MSKFVWGLRPEIISSVPPCSPCPLKINTGSPFYAVYTKPVPTQKLSGLVLHRRSTTRMGLGKERLVMIQKFTSNSSKILNHSRTRINKYEINHTLLLLSMLKTHFNINLKISILVQYEKLYNIYIYNIYTHLYTFIIYTSIILTKI
jgi:hypothetical protein